MRIQRLRKFLSFFLALRLFYRSVPYLILLIALILGLPAPSGAQQVCPPDGDVDQNGAVTAADALLVFQQALGLAQLDACQRTIADVFPQPADPDGAITASDALCVFRKALGLPSCLDTLPVANQPPVANAGADQSVDAGVMVFLSGSANDPDGTIASHAWTQTAGTPVSLTGSDAATAVFVAPELHADETLTFRLTVTDDEDAQASDEVSVTVHAVMAPVDQASAAEVFRLHISVPVVQTKCINCHVANGASGHTRLVFARPADTPDHEAQNLQAFQNFLAAAANEGGGSYVLNKIQGVGHGGGVQVSPGTAEFANMQRFLSLLGEELAPSAPVTVETLFDTAILASPRKTLRRAALIFAGRIPTDEEYAAVEAGDDTVLRATIRGLMEGPQFHEFLIRASNDRLLTDREDGVISDPSFVSFINEAYRRNKAALSSGDRSDYEEWESRVQHGAVRAPLELIAHVAKNDLPYTEILTANYIMANPWAAKAYGAPTQFNDPADPYEFQPSQIVSYYRKGEGFEAEYDPVLGWWVVDPGPWITEYPHAGVLNTTVFLKRYPTTATNRNRARARWTYYHFLGHDVEKSASRTTDPAALADSNNPTLHNSNCTVCHQDLDPVAGAFQNYSDDGFYRNHVGGLDVLDGFYKDEVGKTQTIQAETWQARETLRWPLQLASGVQTLRVMFTNPFYDENTDTQRLVYLDSISVTDNDAVLIDSHEFEDLGPPTHPNGWECGWADSHDPATVRSDHLLLHWGHPGCAIFLAVQIPAVGVYTVEIVAWAYPNWFEQYGNDGFAKLSVVANAYEEGDTWYRDMRPPGFAGAEAPHPESSVQWLAQRIVADERFAQAAVRFWWPAIMGSEIAEPPEDAADADFKGRLLAFNAQDAEVKRLADGFRDGFPGSPFTYNLKDLLVEIALSRWFRADTVRDADPVRHAALSSAGARRLLTPEELARKTSAITGVQWGRGISLEPWRPLSERRYNALTRDYRLLYGGIDSDGVTERARDMTSVMAGVAKRHSAETSCPVVMRELFLLSEGERRLFGGIEREATPVSEFSGSFDVEGGSRAAKQTISLSGPLTAGPRTVRVTYLNDYSDEFEGDRNVYLDRLEVRNAAGRIISIHQLEELGPSGGCNSASGDHYAMWCSGSIKVQVDIPASGHHTMDILVWAEQAGDELPKLTVAVESDSLGSAGSEAIRGTLVQLHDKLLGVQVTPYSPEVQAAYRLFVDVWERQRQFEDPWFHQCAPNDQLFFEGILDGAVIRRENSYGYRWYEFDRDRIQDFLDGVDFSDPGYTAQTWVVVLAAMMMDYRYLYL